MRLFLILPIILLATSCAQLSKTKSVIVNRDKQFLEAKSIPPLRIPPGVSSQQFHNKYPVSTRNYENRIKYVDVMPPDL